MKKLLFSLIASAGVLAACNPICDERTLELTDYTADEISNCITFSVFMDEECTQPAGEAEGNWVHYTTNPATQVAVLTFKSDGSENILAKGASGTFKLSPKRGSANEQTVYVRVVNTDNSEVMTSKTVSVWVKGDLDPEYKLLLGENGKKAWMWDASSGNCWGNAGNSGNGSAFTARTVDGKWWGVALPDSLTGQLQHSNTGIATGEESVDAYMIFDEDNNVATYKADGTVIRKGTYEIKNYDPERKSGWQIATLETSVPALLFPFSINEGGKTVTTFDLMYLDANHMTLVYTKGNAAGSWNEITYWLFKNKNDYSGALNGGSKRKWGWANDGVEVWGNAGNGGNGAGFTYNVVDGKWWGVTSAADLTGQLGHSDTGVATGEEDDNAYMIFDSEGGLKSYDAAGNVIRQGSYELDMYEGGRGTANWELGKLKLSEGAILFPFSINEGGVKPKEYDVMYLDGDNMTLVYTKNNPSGSWNEITYWRFAAKE